MIVREAEAERELAERSAQVLARIRQADDLDREWPVVELVGALGCGLAKATSAVQQSAPAGC